MIDRPETLTIVAGYDRSDAARRALSRIGQLARRRLALTIVAVAPEVRSPGLLAELTGRPLDPDQQLEEARALAEGQAAIAIETRAATGDPAAVVIETAREVGAELLIVGRRGRDFVARTLLGSVAQRVVENAPCDVLVVR